MSEAPSVFLCYAKEDKAAVESIYVRLKQAGLAPWMDKPPAPYFMDGLRPGERWDKRIRSAIRSADYVIAFLSPVSVSKGGYVQREYRLALDRMNELPEDSVFLIPVLLAECEPPAITVGQVSFRDVQWYDLYNRGLGDLVDYVQTIATLRANETIALGNRLVTDFGTSSTAIAHAASTLQAGQVAFDVGAGTTDIGVFPVRIGSGDHTSSLSDRSSDSSDGTAAHLYRLATSEWQLRIVRYLHGVDDDWVSLTTLFSHGGAGREATEEFLDGLCRASVAEGRGHRSEKEYRLSYRVI